MNDPTKEPTDISLIKDAYLLYEEGKKRRYNLLFSVNGGAFLVAKILTEIDNEKQSIVLGNLTLDHLSIGLSIFTLLMIWDIYAFGLKMRNDYLSKKVFGIEGQAILILIGLLIISGWFLAAPNSHITKSHQIIALLFPLAFLLGLCLIQYRNKNRDSTSNPQTRKADR